MPWSFRFVLISLGVVAAGGGYLFFALLFIRGWNLLEAAVWGMVLACAGLLFSSIFSVECAVLHPAWRTRAILALIVSMLLYGLLVFFHQTA